jgi:hypothetical protein
VPPGPGQQHPVAAGISRDSDYSQLPAQVIQQAGGMSAGVGVSADDGISSACEHGHSGRPFKMGAVSGRHRPGWDHQTAHL